MDCEWLQHGDHGRDVNGDTQCTALVGFGFEFEEEWSAREIPTETQAARFDGNRRYGCTAKGENNV